MILEDIYVNMKWWGTFIPSDTEEYKAAMIPMIKRHYDTEDVVIVKREVDG